MTGRRRWTGPAVFQGLLATTLTVVAVAACAGGPEEDPPDALPRPASMAALGDSITRAFAACERGGDCVEASWATGTAEGLDSHAQRLGIDDAADVVNLAVSGARVAGLAGQVRAAAVARPEYVTVLVGANDACAADEADMTPVEEYTAAFGEALDELVRALPETRVLVLSVPDLSRLWEVGRDRPEVVRTWRSFGICASMLADPEDTGADAQGRRDRVRARVQAYNAAMAAACDRHAPNCRSDRNAVFDTRFDLADVSTADYWHPSSRGQATLARVAWEAGFWS
ncbi:MAG: SGNH/GDSL hydrolase family protein [Actinomycetes bacterium]